MKTSGLSSGAVSNALWVLQEAGYITRQPRRGEHAAYLLHPAQGKPTDLTKPPSRLAQ